MKMPHSGELMKFIDYMILNLEQGMIIYFVMIT